MILQEVPPGKLFLGHEVAQGESALVLDREDLVTHAVVLGRTGSGKTGLMHVLLEEAVLQGASAMVLDPKGDLTNLLLAFPGLDPRDLMRWVPAGKTAPEEALRIKEGLERSGQSVERISQWKKAASFHVYSPGKLRGGGSGVDVLPSFGAPPREASLSSPAKRERASAIVSAILHALSVEADPLSDPRHVYLTELVLDAWSRGEPLPLEKWSERLAKPPASLSKIDAIAIDDFLPPGERTKLARTLVGFRRQASRWLVGVPLDVSAFLSPTKEGKPRVSVFTLRHLDEADRAFFSALLLAGLVEWMFRAGSSSRLRAVFAIDEARGYLPPHPHDPPTKRPLATLLSQARAQGLGLIVGTQHPVDLDYKALSNVGTWFLGGLRSRDLKRDLEAELKDRGVEAEVLENLPERSFLALTKDKRARAVRIRFALSYLRGPLESDELSDLPQDAPPLPERDDSGEAGSTPRAIGSASETQKSVSETPSMGPGDPSDGSPGRIDASPGPKNESPGRIDGSPGPNTESAGRIDGSQGPKMESSGLKSESPRPIESSPRSSDSPSREPIDGSDLSKDPWSKIASPPARKRVSTNSQTVPETTAFVHAAPASSCTCEKCRGKPTPGARATEWRASVFARVALTFGGDVGTPIFTRDVFLAAPLIEKDAKAIDWKTAVRLDPAAFTQRAPQGFHLFDPVPDGIFKSSGLSVLRSSAEAAARARFGLVQHEDPARGLAQREGESREAFFARVQERAKDDKRTSAESQREDVRAKLRAEVETIRRELGVSLPSDLSHAIATLVLGPYSPLHFAEKLGADSRAAESWKRPEDVRDRLERVLVALERAQAAFAKPSSAARPGLTARVLEPREVRVDAIGLAWTRAS